MQPDTRNKTPSKIVKLKDGAGLEITWEFKEAVKISSELLRKNCPCASCLELRGKDLHSKPLGSPRIGLRVIKASSEEETNLLELWAIGSYAIGIKWGDGHDSGIYSFKLLNELLEKINLEETDKRK